MENFIINGPSELQGKVKISGSKNEALKLIPLAITLKGSINIENVPKIKDIFSQLEIFKVLGGKVDFQDDLVLDGNSVNKFTTVGEHSKSLRASIVYLGPLLSKFKKAEIPFPGGCAIGLRPIDTHLDAFKDLGASIKKNDESVCVSLDHINNNRIKLKEQSVSATENVILYLSSVRNNVTIENCAIEPEIMHLIEILKSGGADIVSPANRVFRIKGTDRLNIKRIKVMPDRIEAGTFLIAIAATGGSGEIYPFQKQYLETPLKTLEKCGVRFRCTEDKCIVYNSPDLSSFEITTNPYPGFPTDLQPPMALIAARAKGISVINETMFENRLNYLNNMGKMGLEYRLINKNKAEISGPCSLRSSKVESLDLRAGITILIAAIMAKGRSVIKGAEIIDRGYENIEHKLGRLGADITRTNG